MAKKAKRKSKPRPKSRIWLPPKPKVPPKPDPSVNFATIGVRFIDGPDPWKIFTYQVKRGSPVHVGQELVGDTPRGPKLCICVRLDQRYNQEDYPGELKTITRRVVAL